MRADAQCSVDDQMMPWFYTVGRFVVTRSSIREQDSRRLAEREPVNFAVLSTEDFKSCSDSIPAGSTSANPFITRSAMLVGFLCGAVVGSTCRPASVAKFHTRAPPPTPDSLPAGIVGNHA